MRLDKFNNPIFNSHDVFTLLYQGKVDCLKDIVVDINQDLKSLEVLSEITLNKHVLIDASIEDYDRDNQQTWYMPEQYKLLDIESHIFNKVDVNNNVQMQRVAEELYEFKQRGMYPLLRWLVYFVDTCIEHKIVWGVGRGSSVSSYVLFLIGVHKIDSLKFNLSWADFLR